MTNRLASLIIVLFCVVLLAATCFSGSKQPSIIVNMPADGKALTTLPAPDDKVISGDRATLWWTVFKTVLDNDRSEYRTSIATRTADAAVDKVYGSAPR